MTILKPQSGVPLLLGKQGEYNVTAVDFSDFLRSYAQEFGQGTLTVTHQRYEDDGPYAVPLADGIWTVRETDLEYAGNGICELIYSFPNGTKKSTKWQTQVLTGLGQTIDPPEPWQAYIDRVLEAVASVENVVAGEAARRAAESARVSAESTRTARETARQQSENVRISAESNRNAAERNRVSQEASRVNAESARATAETARAKAETSRAATFSAVTAQATEAAATARQMAIAAEEAAETADAAAQAATQVVSRVDEAVSAAEAASASAAQAVSSAQTAVTNANAAVARVESYADDMTAVKRDTAQAKSEAQSAKSEAQSAAAAAAAAVKTVNNTAPDSTGNVKIDVDTRKIESDIADLQTDLSTLTGETGELKSALESLDSTVVKTVNGKTPVNGNVDVEGGGAVDEVARKALNEITVDVEHGSGELINFAIAVQKGYYNNTGELKTNYAGYMSTNPIRVKNGDKITVLKPSNTSVRVSTSGVIFDENGTAIGTLTPSYVSMADYSVTINAESAYTIRVNLYRDVTDYTTVPGDFAVYKNDEREPATSVKRVPPSAILSAWNERNGVAFGTSLTARARTDVSGYGYLMYLPELLGVTVDNQGHSSAYWCHWTPTSTILNDVLTYAGYADKDFAIIEGCVNDWSANRPLGTYTDTESDTVCGCLHQMLEHISTQNNSIQIIVLIDHYGKTTANADVSYAKLNAGELTQYDYYSEVEKCCRYHGVPCIREYEVSSIGRYGEAYLADQIHLTDLGAKQSARAIAQQFALIQPKVK